MRVYCCCFFIYLAPSLSVRSKLSFRLYFLSFSLTLMTTLDFLVSVSAVFVFFLVLLYLFALLYILLTTRYDDVDLISFLCLPPPTCDVLFSRLCAAAIAAIAHSRGPSVNVTNYFRICWNSIRFYLPSFISFHSIPFFSLSTKFLVQVWIEMNF